MFSLSKNITRLNKNFFTMNHPSESYDQFDIFSIMYSLRFSDMDTKTYFNSGVFFFLCLDKYENTVQATLDISSLCENSDTHTHTYHSKTNKFLNQKVVDVSGETLYFSKKNFINPDYQFDKCTINELLELLYLEVKNSKKDMLSFIQKHNIEQNIEETTFNNIFENLNKEFQDNMNIESLREKQPKFIQAEAIHQHLVLNNDMSNHPTQNHQIKVKKF